MSPMTGVTFLLGCTFIFFATSVVAQGDPKSDVECTEGSRWRRGCNWCFCNKGIGTCTRKGCNPALTEKLAQEPDCEGASEWKKREVGNNKCLWCVCEGGKGACEPIPCSKGDDQASNETNIGGGQSQPTENDRNKPTDSGGLQNQPNAGGSQFQPTDFGGPQNKPTDFGGPQNRPTDLGGSENRPIDFGGSQNQPTNFGGLQNKPNDFGGSSNQPNTGGREWNPQNDFGTERNQPNTGDREQDQPRDFGGTRNQQNRPFGISQNQTDEAAGALTQPGEDGESSSGRECTVGSRWRDRCNWCNCETESGAAICTRRACRPGETLQGAECEGNSEWKKVVGGDCSWCACKDGKAVCDAVRC